MDKNILEKVREKRDDVRVRELEDGKEGKRDDRKKVTTYRRERE